MNQEEGNASSLGDSIVPEEENALQEEQKPRAGFERFAMVVLILLIMVTLVFGVASLLQSIQGPFRASGNQSASQAESTSTQSAAAVQLSQEMAKERLKTIDTDGDGFFDYDEIYVYHTSPYLKDTDSDGYDDKQEVTTGHDPNCPAGTVCNALPPTVAASTSTASVPQGFTGLDSLLQGTDPATSPPSLQDAISQLENLTPVQVRQVLVQNGIPQAQLQGLDDAMLMQLYTKSLQDLKSGKTALPQGASGQGSAAVPQASVPGDTSLLTDPASATPAKVREFLRASGKLSESQLQKIDDASLMKIYRESLQKAQTKTQAQAQAQQGQGTGGTAPTTNK